MKQMRGKTIAGDNGNSSVYLDPVVALSSITVTGNQWADRPAMSPSGCRCCDTLSPATGRGGGGVLHPSKASQDFRLGYLIMVQMSRVQKPPASNRQPPASKLQPIASSFRPPGSNVESSAFNLQLLTSNLQPSSISLFLAVSKWDHWRGFKLAFSR